MVYLLKQSFIALENTLLRKQFCVEHLTDFHSLTLYIEVVCVTIKNSKFNVTS